MIPFSINPFRCLTKCISFFHSIESVNIHSTISSMHNLLQTQHLISLKFVLKESFENIEKTNQIVYTNPYICSTFSPDNPVFKKHIEDLNIFKKSLISELRKETFLSSKSLFMIYQFLIFSQNGVSRDIFLDEFDVIAEKHANKLDFNENMELLWLNILRKKEQRLTKFMSSLLSKYNKDFFVKIPNNPLIKAMIFQIKTVYPSHHGRGLEEVLIQDPLIMRNINKIREFVGKKEELMIFHRVQGFTVPLYDEKTRMVYEILTLNKVTVQLQIFNQIRKKILIEKGAKIREIIVLINEQKNSVELEYLDENF